MCQNSRAVVDVYKRMSAKKMTSVNNKSVAGTTM